MKVIGLGSNRVALNCMIDRLFKAGYMEAAMRLFESMETKDDFTYSSVVHSLCKLGRFRSASKVLLSCLRSGTKILKSAQKAVLTGLKLSGYRRDAKKLQSQIYMARVLARY